MLVAQAVAFFVEQNREEVRSEYENLFREWKKDGAAVKVARSNARADTVRWIEAQIGLEEDQRAAYDQLQDQFTMRAFIGGVEKIAEKMIAFYGEEVYTGSGLELHDDLIIDDEVVKIGANNPGKLHPGQMADRNDRAGHFFFTYETMEFFQSIIETSCTDRGVFITSEKFDLDPRHYRVRVFLEDGDVVTVSEKIGTIERAREIMIKVDARIARSK